MVRRYYSKVRQAYTSVHNQQPEAIDNDGGNKGHESDLSPESSSNSLSDDGESDDKCDSLQKRSTVKAELNDEQRQNFVYETLKIQKDVRLPKGSHDTLSAKYKISVKTVKRLW